ncbi:MAG: formylglycine-generating enzyme family protein [Spirochaetaceae bacterium]|jgi:formylglycine-generating enzyme required for sulfatase activity|nr:formylglycine-generating enzyme family protein [Spirochaetaceae bacterium]
MKSNLQIILNRIVKERGIGILDKAGQCKALLHDYAKGTFKREIHLFVLSLEAGCHRELLRTEEPEPIKQRLIWKLQDDYGIIPAYAEETITLLGTLIEERELTDEEKAVKLEKAAQKGDYRSQYELGLLCKKLQKYEAALYWFETAARRGIDLYEELQKPHIPRPIPDDFVPVTGGTFIMGSPDAEWGRKDNETQHEVWVSGFYIGKHEVTQEAYLAVIGTNPSHFRGANLPVESVSWFDAVAYCNARSEQEGRIPAYIIDTEAVRWNLRADGYRLPTEAEWEYACRAGTATPFSIGNNITTDQSNYNGRYPYNTMTKGVFRQTPLAIGSFPPNPWGLYDMHGNLWEWCWDWYGAYPLEPRTNLTGPASGADRVIRGGSWCSLGQNLRSANRGLKIPSYRAFDLGFRLLLPGRAE